MMKKRNGALSFWAFIFCMIFVLHYAYFFDPAKLEKGAFYFYRGELAIDFFFIVAGILLAKTVNAVPDDRALTWREYGGYLKGKLRFYLPAFVICWAVSFVVINKAYTTDVNTLLNNFLTSLLELLPFRSVGFNAAPVDNITFVGYRVMDQAWVISAAFIALMLLYPLYRRGRKRFEYYIAPVGAVLLLCFLFFRTKVLSGDNLLILDGKNKYLFYSFIGTYKALAEILAGVTSYVIVRHFSTRPVSKAKSHLLSLVELGGYLAAICYMQFMLRFELPKMFDFLAIGAMLLGVTVSLSEKSSISKLFNNQVFRFLGRFSLYPFLTFMVFAKTLPHFLPDIGLKMLTLIYLALTLIFAIIVMLLEKPFVKLAKSMKRLFIKPQPKKETA
ncbi:MAG: acyltransferase family protein [Ruminococcus sp.]|nr:acyltransferase family protein [Ruminococcus sp.]